MTLYIEFIGRPSAGKSTTAHDVFSKLKQLGLKVEFVSEYAKELVYARKFSVLEDQLKVSSEQNFRENILMDQVDFVVTDTSLALAGVYNKTYCPEFIESLIEEMRSKKQYITFFVENKKGEYRDYGRTQTAEEAFELEGAILSDAEYFCNNLHKIDKQDGAEAVINKLKELELL